jgi:hypothetical protein
MLKVCAANVVVNVSRINEHSCIFVIDLEMFASITHYVSQVGKKGSW